MLNFKRHIHSFFFLIEFLIGQCGFEPGSFTELLSGGMAGVVEWNICLPFDTFKTRVQASSNSSLRQVWDKLILEQGYTGLYKGYVPVMMRAFPANAAPFFVISIVKSWLEKIWHLEIWRSIFIEHPVIGRSQSQIRK